MELVTGATSRLLPKLGALLKDEYKLQHKVRKDVESLQNELIFMNATLRMVASVPRNQLDEHVRIWAVIIKDVSYDMEDVVSTFVARVHGAPRMDGLIKGLYRKSFNMLCMGRTHHQIAGMVEEIKGLIKEVSDLRDRYRFDNIVTRAATPIVVLQRENMLTTYLAADCEQISHRLVGINYEVPVGVEEDMKVLHNWITSKENDRSMMSIFGPGGVGKTTIAMALYQNYGDMFERRAMVNVSEISSCLPAVLVDILRQVKPQELQGHDAKLDEIRCELQECLREKRFLIVIDDVWTATMLEQIRNALPESKSGSRVIVTTRFGAVAGVSNTIDCVHEIGLLSDEKAKQLFLKVVSKEIQTESLPKLWEMCGGLPLSIATMAGQVACNPDKSDEEWTKVCTALAPRPSTSHTAYQLTMLLSTCYNDMPVEIKTCALYFSIFPRGQTISRKRLTRRWISDGFAHEQEGMSAEEVAEAYLNHLIRRKILRAVKHSSHGKVKSYQVIHDKVLEYIVSKASEENFATAIGDLIMPPPSTKIHRMSFKYSGSSYEKEIKTMNLSHVRDLTMFGSMKQLPSSSFKFGGVVQLLDLEGCKDFKHHHTKEICRMLLLKYLSLRRTDIKKLTKRIGNLRFLETLDIRETNVIELPSAICKLEVLVNIFGGNKRTRKALKLPKELGKRKNMKALRTLTGIEISEMTPDIHHLMDLRKLAIYKLKNNMEDFRFPELSSWIEYLGGFSLSALVIHDESTEFFKSLDCLSSPPKFLNALELSGKLLELPGWVAKLNTLTKLTLSLTALRADNLELLSKICSLFSLTFSLHAAKQDQETAEIVEENKACSDGVILFPVGGFEKLNLLRFFAPCVPQLSFQDGAVPTLERLELRFSNFEGLVGIKGLKNLQEVHIKVYDEASETTESIMKEMATAAREDPEGPRIIFN